MGRDDSYRFELEAHPGWSNGAARYDDGLAAQQVVRPALTEVPPSGRRSPSAGEVGSPGRSPSPEPTNLPPPVAPVQRLPSPHRHTRYDAYGNLTRKSTAATVHSYAYDFRNLMTSYNGPGANNDTTYKYDALGRRIGKVVGGSTTTRYCYDVDNVVAEYNGSDQLQRTYVTRWLDANLSLTSGGSTYYYLKDALGSVRQVLDPDQATANSYDYQAFGSEYGTPTENLTQPFRFTGRDWDTESGLYYYRMREYVAARGSFASRDPVYPFWVPRAYGYVMNLPTFFVDPLGLLNSPYKLWVSDDPGHVDYALEAPKPQGSGRGQGKDPGLFFFGFGPKGGQFPAWWAHGPGVWEYKEPGQAERKFRPQVDNLLKNYTLVPITQSEHEAYLKEVNALQAKPPPGYVWVEELVVTAPPGLWMENCVTAYVGVHHSVGTMSAWTAFWMIAPGQMSSWAKGLAEQRREMQE